MPYLTSHRAGWCGVRPRRAVGGAGVRPPVRSGRRTPRWPPRSHSWSSRSPRAWRVALPRRHSSRSMTLRPGGAV